MSIRAYQRAATQGDTPRDLEYRVFGLVTADLMRLKQVGDARDGAAAAAALDANRRLWNVLSADCAMAQNQLPPTLRTQIISLALWVSRYSSDVLHGAEVDPLIDVNRAMMEGLSVR